MSRTKAALAAAKRRGVRLGNPHLEPGTKASALVASCAAQTAARARADDLRDVVKDARAQGCITLRQLAAHLDQGTTSSRFWYLARRGQLYSVRGSRRTG